MQIKDHLSVLRQSLWFILIFGLVVGVVTYGLASRRPAMYQAVQTYDVRLVNRAVTPDYQYGSYYDLKGAELFTQHVMSLLRSPAIITDIYSTAGLGFDIDSLSRFTSQFRTDQDSSQQFTVTFSRYQESEAKALANAMTTVLVREVKLTSVDTAGQSLFALGTFDPVIVYQPTNVTLVTIVGVVAGWLLALLLVYTRRYLH